MEDTLCVECGKNAAYQCGECSNFICEEHSIDRPGIVYNGIADDERHYCCEEHKDMGEGTYYYF